MNLYAIPQWIADIDTVTQVLPELPELAGKTVMITGTAGLICSAVADIIVRYNETHEVPINLLAAGRCPEKMKNRFGPYCGKSYFKFVTYDAAKGNNDLNIPCDYVIHGASNATPDLIVKEPVETMCSNFIGLLELLRYSADCGAKRVLYISSSEVYGKKEGNEPYQENEYGYIDLLNPRNSYVMRELFSRVWDRDSSCPSGTYLWADSFSDRYTRFICLGFRSGSGRRHCHEERWQSDAQLLLLS